MLTIAAAAPKEVSDGAKGVEASVDFEAGIMFNRYDKSKTGVLTADDFRQMWRESKAGIPPLSHSGSGILSPSGSQSGGILAGVDPTAVAFEAGQIFAKYDSDRDGKLDKKEFELLMKNYPELMKVSSQAILSKGGSSQNSSISLSRDPNANLPMEVISGRLLTHYDETAGIAIPRSAIEQHRGMGNTVVPLLESYRSRYDRLRTLLTARLLPRREHLLQLRRQLQHTSVDVAATRKNIERETMNDAEQIIERLRTIESMRQSSIKNQTLQIEEDLEMIERIVRRVELANDDGLYNSATGVLLTSAVPGSVPVETVRGPRAASMVELIQQFADISSHIERLACKPITVQVDFPTDDFPRETAERLEIIARCDRYTHAISVKDHMLWSALQDKEKVEEQLADERKLSHEYAQEVANWAEVAQDLGQQVAQIKQDKDKMEKRNRELINLLREHNIFYMPHPKD